MTFRFKPLLASVALAGLASAAASTYIREKSFHKPAFMESWKRKSFSGTSVSLSEGIVATSGALASSLATPAPVRTTIGTALASGAGYVDDHLEGKFPAQAKGFRGHLGALSHGQVTSGLVKILCIGGASALTATAFQHRGGRLARCVSWAGDTALIALSANFINLLDLRPGRAGKACVGVGLALLPTRAAREAAGLVTTSLVCLPEDLAGETMLGDMGANALGFQMGVALCRLPAPVRVGALAGIAWLTMLSEKVSFSKVIETNPVLAGLDSLGRQDPTVASE